MSFILLFIFIALAIAVSRYIFSQRQQVKEEELRRRFEAYRNEPVRCPVCGSASVQMLQGPFKTTALWFAFGALFCIFGGGKPRNYCMRCGHKWKAGK